MSLTRPAIVLLLLTALALTLALRHCPRKDNFTVERSRIIMGTVVVITAIGAEKEALEAAVTAAFEEMSRLEQLLSPHIDDSDVARLSRSEKGLAVAPETREVIALGLEATKRSGGAFDLGLGRLKSLWDIEGEHPRVPTDDAIATALQGTGAGALRIEGERIIKADPALQVDLGGIAKGYAVDRALATLAEAGIESASVNAGGDLRLLGDKAGRPWRIGIQHPRRPETILAVLPLRDQAVVTSGDYERFFEADGVRYHHLFDPKSGRPARGCQSVTVVAPTAAWADALATIAFVLGPSEGLFLLESEAGVEGLIVDSDGRRHLSSGLQGQVEWR